MKQIIANVAIVVKDYDEAIRFYTDVLDFELIEDTQLSAVKRWVRVCPPGQNGNGTCLLLAKAKNAEEEAAVGYQSGNRVFLFLHTDDFDRDHAKLVAHDVTIVRGPAVEPHGKVCVFIDLYGNKWDLIEPA